MDQTLNMMEDVDECISERDRISEREIVDENCAGAGNQVNEQHEPQGMQIRASHNGACSDMRTVCGLQH